MAIAECVSGINIRAISVFSTAEDLQPNEYSAWVLNQKRKIQQALSTEDTTCTMISATEGKLSILTEFGKNRGHAAVSTTLELDGIYSLSWRVDYRQSLTGPWMPENMERTLRHGLFYQIDILPLGHGIRFKGYNLSLAEEPLSTLITPFGGIIRAKMSGQVISVYSPLETMFSKNGNGQHSS